MSDTTPKQEDPVPAAGKRRNVFYSMLRGYVWTFTGDLNETRDSFKRTRANIRRLLDQAFKVRRVETFEEAVKRQNLSEQDLDEKRRKMGLSAYFNGLILLVSLILFALSPWTAAPVSYAFLTGGVVLVSFVRLLIVKFRLAQLHERRFFSLREWLFSNKQDS